MEVEAAEPPATVVEALEDDLNTPAALAALFELAREANRADSREDRVRIKSAMLAAGELLGLLGSAPADWFAAPGKEDAIAEDEIERLIEARRVARAERDFARADAIRDQLQAQGVAIEDSADGVRWRRVG